LEPDTVDAHKDTIPADVILDAAEDFLANINVKTTMGVMHKDLKAPLELVQSFVVPDSDITINSVLVKKGSWVITVRVNSDDIWQQIKDGKLTGFSIGGKARVQSLKPQAVV
jgi:DNA adenine methylase